jgi:hypothetical protein
MLFLLSFIYYRDAKQVANVQHYRRLQISGNPTLLVTLCQHRHVTAYLDDKTRDQKRTFQHVLSVVTESFVTWRDVEQQVKVKGITLRYKSEISIRYNRSTLS